MDSDAWRPFDPVDVKRQVGPGRGAATTGRVSSNDVDDEDYDSDGDLASGYCDYTWLDVGVVTFITLKIDDGA